MTVGSSRAGAGALMAAVLAFASPARSQSTDAYHGIQILPVVADTASFTQRFHFRKLLAATTNISPTYFPARGTSQSGPLACPSFVIPTLERTFTSLRELCPGLPDGPQFGYMRFTQTGGAVNRTFSVYSRASSSAGAGFSVEAFPAHVFTEAFASVSGIRRLAAANGAPAYQTNCFIARLDEVEPLGTPGPMRVFYGAGDSEGNQIGSSSFVDLERGEMVRILDIFSAVGAPAQNFNDANFRVSPDIVGTSTVTGALMSFCTVQENTSLGADFRIAKTEFGTCGSESCTWMNPMDDHVNRETTTGRDIQLAGDVAGRTFSIPSGAFQNSHVYYFRHPDFIACELINPQTNVRATLAYGLEMRLTLPGGAVIAGGNDVTGFGPLYLGDKRGGVNTRYVLQVESNEGPQPAERPYQLRCQSGSGHTPGDTVRFNAPIDQF
jgi:hypothetical protein